MSVDELNLDSTVRKSKDSFEAQLLVNEFWQHSNKKNSYSYLICYYSYHLPRNGVTRRKVLFFKEIPQKLILAQEEDIYSKNVNELVDVKLVLINNYIDPLFYVRTDSLPTEKLKQINRERLDSLEKKYPGIKTDPCGNTVISILEENYPEPHGLLDTARAKYWIDKFTKR
ncbi:hypothetical protein [Xanthocytophaga agilis]|uniref:Uncharacterized protein n=1 Tax=Xanthocytophaga agilis TaxID=3048010 RepID=A0AAE3QWC5_9BACT|nr:hypothetical protein [Xanthocytophaga agilis]MDJ1499256.1 hypothetical protein [Xanthocytophaga agilis]